MFCVFLTGPISVLQCRVLMLCFKLWIVFDVTIVFETTNTQKGLNDKAYQLRANAYLGREMLGLWATNSTG